MNVALVIKPSSFRGGPNEGGGPRGRGAGALEGPAQIFGEVK